MTEITPAVGQDSIERLVRHVANTDPDTVALAEVLSLAVRVDPALLRAARRRFLPHRGPDLEADLWHSPLVSGANRSGLLFDQAVADRLLLRLARHPERYERAWQVIEGQHRADHDKPGGGLPDTLRLEERLRYLAQAPDGYRRALRLLQQVKDQVDTKGAKGLQGWFSGLESRLPSTLRRAADTAGRRDRPKGGADHAASEGQTVGLRLLDTALEIRATPFGSMHRLRLPADPPPAILVDGRLVALGSLPHVEPLGPASRDKVKVQALDGTSLTLLRRRRQLTPPLPQVIQSHTAETWGCAFSPDGTLLATTSADRTVRFWDAATGAAVRTLTGHAAPVTACAFSPDGSLLASASDDGTARLWDTSTGAAVHTIAGHRGEVRACAFSSDGTLLATAGADRTARLWDAATGQPLRSLTGHTAAVTACAFSSDGSLLATTSRDRTVRLWRSASGKLRHELIGYAFAVEGAAFSPDGALLAVASADRTVRLWDPTSGKEVRTLTGHTSSVLACTFSADGGLLASTGNDGTVILWDPATGEQLHKFGGHGGRLHSCAFSPDGSLLAATGDDGNVRLWDPTVAPPVQRLVGHTSWVYGCAYAPDGSYLATASADHTVRLWDPPTGAVLLTLDDHTNAVEACAVSPDGRRIATASADRIVRIWDTSSGKLLRTLDAHVGRVHACAFSPDGTLLATASADGTVVLWDPDGGESVDRLRGHTGPVQACAFSADGRLLATAGDDQSVRLWDPATGEQIRFLTGHIREVLACAFSPDGRRLASTGIDQAVRLWDPTTGESTATLRGHESRVHACAFSPDGTLLATASADSTLRLWDPERAEVLDELAGPAAMLDCRFSPDGTVLAGTCADHTVSIWNLLTRKIAVKGDTVALWLGGRPGDAAVVAGAVAARPRTAGCTPVVAGGGAIPGVLLAAGLTPRRVLQEIVHLGPASRGRGQGLPLVGRWLDPIARLERLLAGAGAVRTGDLRVPIGDRPPRGEGRRVPADDRLQRYRFHAVVIDTTTDEVVVLPRDAKRLGLDPDQIPLAGLALAAADRRELTVDGRRFTSALDRSFDPGPWYADLPARRHVFAVDVEDGQGTVPARRFPQDLQVTMVTVPWLYRPDDTRPTRRQREILARIGAQSLRSAVTDEPGPLRRNLLR